MKFSKPWAFLFLLGLCIHAIAPAPDYGLIAPAYASSSATASERPAGRSGLPSVSQESESIDSFNVHPENRWSEVETGSFEDTLENGEFMFKGYINDSASMYRYRDAETTSGDIETRWRLNAIADFETNETDWPTQEGDWGPDGWSFEEDTDGWTAENGGTVTQHQGILSDETAVAGFSGARSVTVTFPDIFRDTVEVRVKINDTVNEYRLQFTGGTAPTTDFTPTGSWENQTLDISSSGSSTGYFRVQKNNHATIANISIEYCRLLGDDEYPGDFEIPLIGLNVTTDEGSGNSSLNAYPWNSTHYVLRPSFTTDDGDNWRSWNIESNYQDYFQMLGTTGADGKDFVEGTVDGVSGLATNTAERGFYLGVAAAGATESWFPGYTDTVDPADYTFAKFKTRTNDSTLTWRIRAIDSDGGFQYLSSIITTGSTEWQTNTVNISADPDWQAAIAAGLTFTNIYLVLDETDGTLEGDEGFWVDYWQITSNNDSSDLTFLEYEKYYRAKSKYDLMESKLNWKISDDSDDKLTSTVQGNFKIEDYFDPDELIRDISLGTVGDIDYLFGLRSAGANATCWWDFYLADFQEFLWDSTSVLETNDVWDSKTPYAAYYKVNVHTSLLWAKYRLTVPEFDSASGTFAIQESNADITICALQLTVYSVTAATGALVEELQIEQGDDVGGVTPGSTHNLTISIDGAAQTTFQADGGSLDSSETSFSILFDKVNRSLSLQMSYLNGTAVSLGIAYAATVDSGQSNEFVLDLIYFTGASPAAATGEEVHFQLKQWDLVFRDIFGGLPNSLDIIGSDTSGIIPTDPIAFLLQAFRNLARLMGAAGASLVLTVAVLGNVLNQLVLILAKLTAMAIDINTLTGMVATLTAIAANIVTMTADVGTIVTGVTSMVSDLTGILVDTGLMQSDIFDIAGDIAAILIDTGNIITAIEDLLDALVDGLGDSWLGQIFDILFALVGDLVDELIAEAIDVMTAVLDATLSFFRGITVAGVSIGDLIDFIDAWMVNFWNIAASLISLGTEILTVWTQVFLMGLLGIILIWAAAAAKQDGALFAEKFINAMNFNVNPIGFILEIRIPLGAILLGNLFWVVFTAYDWEGLLIPAVVIASFQLGAAYEIPDYSEQMDDFFEFTTSILEDILDTLLDEVTGAAWKTLVTLLSDDILGASPEIIVFVVTAGIAATILIRGRF